MIARWFNIVSWKHSQKCCDLFFAVYFVVNNGVITIDANMCAFYRRLALIFMFLDVIIRTPRAFHVHVFGSLLVRVVCTHWSASNLHKAKAHTSPLEIVALKHESAAQPYVQLPTACWVNLNWICAPFIVWVVDILSSYYYNFTGSCLPDGLL